MAKKYNCKQCGAELYFDPKRGKLHCEYCGSDFDPSEYDFQTEEEGKEDQVIAQAGNEGEGIEAAAAGENAKATDDSVSTSDLVVYQCPHCGAEMITSKKTVATTCVYCGRAVTLTGNVSGEFKPDYVLPFEVERKEVVEKYKELCGQSFLTPRLFTKESTIEKIKGMYVPYWLYTFDGTAAMDIHGEKIRSYMTGDQEITETSSYEVHEEGGGHFSRIPADAMKEMDNILMDSVEPFDFNKMKKFNPAYLSGFYTQQWDESPSENEPRAKARAKEVLSEEVADHAGKFTTKMIRSERYDWSNQKVEQAMLPVWVLYTNYKGKEYMFGMNGQTGKMVGEIPKDPIRIVEIGGGVLLATQILFLILRVLGVV